MTCVRYILAGSFKDFSPCKRMMKYRAAFFVTGIISIALGLYLMIFVQTMTIDIVGRVIQISTISDGMLLTVMGIAIVIASSRQWDSEKVRE